jgi:hypothetical protein
MVTARCDLDCWQREERAECCIDQVEVNAAATPSKRCAKICRRPADPGMAEAGAGKPALHGEQRKVEVASNEGGRRRVAASQKIRELPKGAAHTTVERGGKQVAWAVMQTESGENAGGDKEPRNPLDGGRAIAQPDTKVDPAFPAARRMHCTEYPA